MIVSDGQVRVLLTGGIGAGKSSVGGLLRGKGALVIDADRVGHQVLEPGGPAFDQVAAAWPEVVVGGVIDRSLLADVVFRSSAELARLEGLTHSAIRHEIGTMIETATEPVVVVEVPLLSDFLGTGWLHVVVDADEGTRVERLVQRGVDKDDAGRRLAAQPARSQWLASADVIIDNSGDSAALADQVDGLWERLTSEASAGETQAWLFWHSEVGHRASHVLHHAAD